MKAFFIWMVAQAIFVRLLFGLLLFEKATDATWLTIGAVLISIVEIIASALVLFPIIERHARQA